MIQSVVKKSEYFEVARRLVGEYVQATAQEMNSDPEEFLPFIDGYATFPGVFANRGDFLLALAGDQAVGCIGLKELSPETCEMKSLWVNPTARGQGLAEALILASLKSAASLGYERITLDVLPSRQGAIKLYRKLGFRAAPLSHDYTFEMMGFGRPL